MASPSALRRAGAGRRPSAGCGRPRRPGWAGPCGRPSSWAIAADRGHRLGGAGDHHLAGGVVVGHPDVALGPLAGRLGVVVGDARAGRPSCPVRPRRPGAMASPRATTRCTPSSKERAPLATRAVYSPRLWPAQAAGERPSRSTASRTTRLWTKVASWALAVWVSSSIGARSSSCLEVAAGRGRGLGHHLPRGVVDPGLAHARPLRSLPGEGEYQHDCLSPPDVAGAAPAAAGGSRPSRPSVARRRVARRITPGSSHHPCYRRRPEGPFRPRAGRGPLPCVGARRRRPTGHLHGPGGQPLDCRRRRASGGRSGCGAGGPARGHHVRLRPG